MTEPLFPEPLDDDDDDVAWALQTAKVQWNRGGQADAIVWLRRAGDSADQLGSVWRAADLRRMADVLEASLVEPRPAALPRFESENDVERLLGEEPEESGITSIPASGAPSTARSSLVSIEAFEVEDFEVDGEVEDEVDPESFDEEVVVDDAASDQIAQLLGTEVELTEEVEVLDELDDEVIGDDALDEPISTERNTDQTAFELADATADDPVTQPQLEDPRLAEIPRRSPLPPLRSTRPGPPPNVLVRAPAPEPPPDSDPQLGDVLLGEVHGLEDVPPEGQAILARDANIERLNAHEEVSSFGLALVLRGAVSVMPAIADLSCARAHKGEIVWSQGNLDDGIALRLVATEDSTEVAVWDADLLKSTVRDYPWVVEDLKTLADRFQALAGVAMGPMGERLDDSLRAMVTERCEIRRLLPGEALTTKGKPVGGMYIVAAGRLEIVDGDAIENELGPGDFLFAPQVLSNGAAPRDSRGGPGGALVLFAGRGVAHELLLSVPPLLEIFAT